MGKAETKQAHLKDLFESILEKKICDPSRSQKQNQLGRDRGPTLHLRNERPGGRR
jgi:hypothetical protein